MGTKYWLGADEGVTFTPSGENMAYTEYADTIPRGMTDHSRTMDPGVFEIVGKGAYMLYGYALSSLMVVVGDDGLILIDPPEDVEKAQAQLAELRKITDLPVRAVVYSHWHVDHYAGVKAFITQEQADSGEVKVIAHRDFMDNIITGTVSGDMPILGARVDYSLGSLLNMGPEGRVNGGIGPDGVIQTVSLVAPNVLVDDRLEHTVAGVRMVRLWAPSEAIDEIVTWFPDLGILQSASLDPIHAKDASARYIALMGGRDAVVAEARRVQDADDHRWAAELLRHVVRADPSDTEARALKAESLRQLGYRTTNANWRNFYLSAAAELDGTIDYSLSVEMNAPDLLGAIPGRSLFEGLRFRVDPDKARDARLSAGFRITDTGETVGLILRNGIVEPTGTIPADANLVIELPKLAAVGMILRDADATLTKVIEDGAANLVTGTLEDARAFFANFDPPAREHITLADR